MLNIRFSKCSSFFVACILAIALPAFAKDSKLTVDELVSKHLDSIGKPEARAAASSRVSQGKVAFAEIIQHSLHMDGSATLISQGRKHRCQFQFGTPHYPGEQFVFDGKNGMIAMVDQTSRSRLGNFLFMQDEILREGLWGGTLSTAWPLLTPKEISAELKYGGIKKIDGRPLQELTYVPKKRSQNGEQKIRLYFDPETFRHVLTEYEVTMLHNSDALSDPNQTTVVVEERFSDFREIDGLMLPGRWDIRYRTEPQNATQEYQWDVTLSSITHNAL
jgi:hypothetical protein